MTAITLGNTERRVLVALLKGPKTRFSVTEAISGDPTSVRDGLKKLTEKGYATESVRAFKMSSGRMASTWTLTAAGYKLAKREADKLGYVDLRPKRYTLDSVWMA